MIERDLESRELSMKESLERVTKFLEHHWVEIFLKCPLIELIFKKK